MNCWILLLLLLCNHGGNCCDHSCCDVCRDTCDCKPVKKDCCHPRHDCCECDECCKTKAPKDCGCKENSAILPPPRADFGYHYDDDCDCKN